MWGCAARFPKSLMYFTPKNVIFDTGFHTRPLKFIPVFRPVIRREVMLSLPRLERKQNNFANAFLIPIFLVLSCSFGIKRINTLISSRSSLENHTRFQAKMGIVYTRFQTKTAQKPYPMGRQISLYEGVPPPPPRGTINQPRISSNRWV